MNRLQRLWDDLTNKVSDTWDDIRGEVRDKLFDPVLRWLGYVPIGELQATQQELARVSYRAIQLESDIEDRDIELRAYSHALSEHKELLASRLNKLAEHLAPMASVRRDPREMQRYQVQVIIELDVLERMLFDYQIKGDSVDFEFLLDGLFHRLRNDFSVLLRLGKIRN